MIMGPESTPYEDGYYHEKIIFPDEFPFKSVSIYMLTLNGRFDVNKKTMFF